MKTSTRLSLEHVDDRQRERVSGEGRQEKGGKALNVCMCRQKVHMNEL